jgi:hypothetical protein
MIASRNWLQLYPSGRPACYYWIRRNEPDVGDAEYDALINQRRARTEAGIRCCSR